MKKPTTREIAKKAGVSPAAVSFALNGKKGISEETRQTILEIARSMDYNPQGAKSRENSGENMPHNIAVLFRADLNFIDQLFYNELNISIMQACEGSPYNLIFTSTRNSPTLPEVISQKNVEGIMIYGDVDQSIIDEIVALEIPFVVLDSSRRNDGQLAVRIEYDAASYLATRHLIELGHRDIAFIGNDNMHDFNVLTFSGFQRAAAESAIALSMNRIQISVYGEASLYASIDNALSGPDMPTALFCATDFYAIHAIRYLYTKGVRVPEDISVVGIDDLVLSRFTIPALTTVRIDRDLIGKYGFELLVRKIRGEACESIRLPIGELIIRESTAIPRR